MGWGPDREPRPYDDPWPEGSRTGPAKRASRQRHTHNASQRRRPGPDPGTGVAQVSSPFLSPVAEERRRYLTAEERGPPASTSTRVEERRTTPAEKGTSDSPSSSDPSSPWRVSVGVGNGKGTGREPGGEGETRRTRSDGRGRVPSSGLHSTVEDVFSTFVFYPTVITYPV